eukprot:6214002-Pleurochrysis_carterae.AAC.3
MLTIRKPRRVMRFPRVSLTYSGGVSFVFPPSTKPQDAQTRVRMRWTAAGRDLPCFSSQSPSCYYSPQFWAVNYNEHRAVRTRANILRIPSIAGIIYHHIIEHTCFSSISSSWCTWSCSWKASLASCPRLCHDQ